MVVPSRNRGLPPTFVILTPAVVCLAVNCFGINVRDTWRDEHASWWAATVPLSALWRLLANIDVVHAPYYLLLRAWVRVFGDSALALRLPATLAMVACAALTAELGRKLFNARVGLSAGVLFALLPSVSRYGQEARSYGFALAAAAFSTLLLLRAAERPAARWRWVAYAGSLVLLASFHLIALTLLAAHATVMLEPRVGAPWLSLRRERVVPWLLAVACALALVAPLARLGSAQSAQIAWTLKLSYRFTALPTMIFHVRRLGLCVIVLGLLALHRPQRGRVLVAVWAVFPPVALYLSHTLLHLFVHRYLLFTLPAWALLAACTVDDLAQVRPFARTRWARSLPPLALLSAMIWLGQREQQRIRTRTKNQEQHAYAEVAALLRKEGRPTDAIAFGGPGAARHWPRLGLLYELRGEPMPRDVFAQEGLAQTGWFVAAECLEPAACLPADTTRMWLVTSTDSTDLLADMPGPRARLLRTTFDVRRLVPFNKVKVVLLERTRS